MSIALGRENIENQIKLAQTEAFNQLVRLLRTHKDSPQVILMVIQVLGILCVGQCNIMTELFAVDQKFNQVAPFPSFAPLLIIKSKWIHKHLMLNLFHNRGALVTKKSNFNYFHLNVTIITIQRISNEKPDCSFPGVAYCNNKVTQRKIAEEGAIPTLVTYLNQPPSEEVQVEVAIALGCIVLSNTRNQELLQEEPGFNFDVLLDLLKSKSEASCFFFLCRER